MWHGRVTAFATQGEREDVEGCHDGPAVHRRHTDRQTGPVMHGIYRLHRETLEEAFLHHGATTALIFFGGLENKYHRTAEVRILCQLTRRTQKHGGVAVMAAGVHPASMGGSVLHLIQLSYVECIHVCTKADGGPFAQCTAQHTHHASTPQTFMHLQPPAAEQFGHAGRGAVLLEGGFRVPMKVVAPIVEILQFLGAELDHGFSSNSYR